MLDILTKGYNGFIYKGETCRLHSKIGINIFGENEETGKRIKCKMEDIHMFIRLPIRPKNHLQA